MAPSERGTGAHSASHAQGASLGSDGINIGLILKIPVQDSHTGSDQPTLDPLLANVRPGPVQLAVAVTI